MDGFLYLCLNVQCRGILRPAVSMKNLTLFKEVTFYSRTVLPAQRVSLLSFDLIVMLVLLAFMWLECSELPCQLQNRNSWRGGCPNSCTQSICSFQHSLLYARGCKHSSSTLSPGLNVKPQFFVFFFLSSVFLWATSWLHAYILGPLLSMWEFSERITHFLFWRKRNILAQEVCSQAPRL